MTHQIIFGVGLIFIGAVAILISLAIGKGEIERRDKTIEERDALIKLWHTRNDELRAENQRIQGEFNTLNHFVKEGNNGNNPTATATGSWETKYTGFSSDPDEDMTFFVRDGFCYLELLAVNRRGDSNSKEYTFSLPFKAVGYTNFPVFVINAGAMANGSIRFMHGSDIARVFVEDRTTSYKDDKGNWHYETQMGFTSTGKKGIYFQVLKYKIF